MDALDRLTAWLAAGGARHDALALCHDGARRGVIATRAIAEGEEVARVPRGLIITRHTARGSSIGRQIRDAGVELSNHHALLAAWLLTERRDPRSPYHPYFDVLPRELPRFPIHASAADRALLAGTLAGAMLDELHADLERDHAALQARVRLFRPIARDDFVWARSCVGSRGFALTIDGIDTTALVPFADMLDHDAEPDTRWRYDQDAEAFTLTAARAIAAGHDVSDSYGAKPNARLLVQYGFCLDDNPDDEAELRFPAPFRVPRDPTHAASTAMLAWLRKQYPYEPAAHAALADAARAALARIPGTAAGDDALLAGTLSPDARNFVVARRGERGVLAAWLAFATDR